MQGQIRTVLGDVPPESLGRTNCHEHFLQVTPLLPGDELDDEELSRQEAAAMAQAGTEGVVEATPVGLGRDPAGLARISASTQLHVVLTTGVHREEHYEPDHWLKHESTPALVGRFVRDLTVGVPVRDTSRDEPLALSPTGMNIRAGLLKAGIGYWSISSFERRVIEALASAQQTTGAPVMVHLEHGSAAFELLDLLEHHGVPADRVALAHIDRNPDPGLHSELAACGAYLGYDGAARSQRWPDSVLLDCLERTCAAGGADRILLGGDVARRRRYVSYGGMPGLAYLATRFVPRVETAVGQATTSLILRENPARWLAWY